MHHGWVIVDKPLHISSHDVVAKVRRIFGQKKVGHGGTLDPLATGVLPIALGEATKTVDYVMDHRKSYEFTVTWGTSTTTDDVEGDILESSPHRPSDQDIQNILSQFTGCIQQMPPLYSALHIEGKRAYDLARQGKTLEDIGLTPRTVEIFSLNYLGSNESIARFEVTCGKGTYVRSLGRDMALTLGTRGHISQLRRTKVGQFTLKDSILLDNLEQLGHSHRQSEVIMPINTVLDDILVVVLDTNNVRRIRMGQTVLVAPNAPDQEVVFCVTEDQIPVALGKISQGTLRSRRVFNI